MGAPTASVLGVREWRVRHVDETGSTNADLLAAARAGEPAGAVLVAGHQTAGRGRLGRQWEERPGSALLVSLLLRPALPVGQRHRLTQAVGVAAALACEQVAGLRPDLKWPNDLVVDDRKLAGILAEAAPEDAVVIGMGLNVHDPAAHADAITLEAASGRRVEVAAVLDAFLAALLTLDDVTLDREYPARLATLGREVRVELPGETVTGRAVGVEPDGQLVVEVGRERRRISAGDVIHLRPM